MLYYRAADGSYHNFVEVIPLDALIYDKEPSFEHNPAYQQWIQSTPKPSDMPQLPPSYLDQPIWWPSVISDAYPYINPYPEAVSDSGIHSDSWIHSDLEAQRDPGIQSDFRLEPDTETCGEPQTMAEFVCYLNLLSLYRGGLLALVLSIFVYLFA